jgi:four helix bundle protein
MTHNRIIPAHRKLIVWQRSMDLAIECHHLAMRLPSLERYELSAQMRSAGVSTYANIAEGAGRRTPPEFSSFLAIARGSAMEVDSHTEFASRVGYFTGNETERAQSLAGEVILMLSSMMNNLAPFRRK